MREGCLERLAALQRHQRQLGASRRCSPSLETLCTLRVSLFNMTRREANTAILAGAAVLVAGPAGLMLAQPVDATHALRWGFRMSKCYVAVR